MRIFVSAKNFKSGYGDVLEGALFSVNDVYDLPVPSDRGSYYIHTEDYGKYFTELDMVLKTLTPETEVEFNGGYSPKIKKSTRPAPLPVSGPGVDGYGTQKEAVESKLNLAARELINFAKSEIYKGNKAAQKALDYWDKHRS